MKKIQLLSIMVISGAIAFGAQTAAVKKANVSFTESLARVESTGSIAEVQYNELSDGLIRGLVFSMQGNALPENLEFEFVNADNFNGTSTIEFKDIFLAVSNGKGVDVEAQSYVVNFGAAVNATPYKTDISDAYPNPFNPSTTIDVNLHQDGFTSVKVYNLMGQEVAVLAEANMSANTYSFTWDAKDVPSGLYMVRAESAGYMATEKLMLLK